jgi:quinohemoprotein ethanol dehydrogenase
LLPELHGTVVSLHPPAERFSGSQVDNGRLLYTQHCYRCHGAGAQSAGVLPDVRRSSALADRNLWRSIVNDGALESAGKRRWSRRNYSNIY